MARSGARLFSGSFISRAKPYAAVDRFQSASRAARLMARLDVRGGVSDFKRLLDLVLDRAGDAVPAIDLPICGHHQVKIHPMIPPAMAMAELVVAANSRRLAGRPAMGVEDRTQQPFVVSILPIHQARDRVAHEHDAGAPDAV